MNRGRGRGRCKRTMSISKELGFLKGEALPPPVLQPPPKYPPLKYKARPPVITTEMSYLLDRKRELAKYMKESRNYVLPLINSYSNRYQDLITDKDSYELRYDWSRMPAELKPQPKKCQNGQSSSTLARKKQKEVDVETMLQELEKKETSQPSDAKEEEKEEEDAEEEDDEHAEEEDDEHAEDEDDEHAEEEDDEHAEDEDDEHAEEEDDEHAEDEDDEHAEEEDDEHSEDEEDEFYLQLDEEMDEGTDYVSNYFDNGEGYDDEDENLDDEPIINI